MSSIGQVCIQNLSKCICSIWAFPYSYLLYFLKKKKQFYFQLSLFKKKKRTGPPNLTNDNICL